MPVLIGLSVGFPAAASDPVADARQAEELGLDFVSASDHLHGATPTHEPWTLLTVIAGATTRLRVATRVLGVPYRHPAVVAKMAATLDLLSGGRAILGLGGGSGDAEFAAFGLPVPPPAEKIERLEEAIRIARGLWSHGEFSYDGHHYRIMQARLEPKPGDRIPIWLGTYRPHGLALTGRLADGWIPSYGLVPPEGIPALRRHVVRGAREAGRDPGEITAVYNMEIRVGAETPSEDGLGGQPEAIVDQLLAFRRLGFAGFNFSPIGPDRAEQIERIGREISPALRQAWD